MKKTICIVLAAIMLIAVVVGCADTDDTQPVADTPPTQAETTDPAAGGDDMTEAGDEDVFNWRDWAIRPGDSVETVISRIEAAVASRDTSYDDLSQEFTFNIFMQAWIPEPFPADNAVQEYFREMLNVNINARTFVSNDELATAITLAYAAADAPDLALIPAFRTDLVQQLSSQGLLEDWTPHLPRLKTLISQVKEYEMEQRFMNDIFVGVPMLNGNDANVWQTWIRQDWLDNLGIPNPRTVEELFEAAYRFTFDDPDGDGIDNTWGFTSFGDGMHFGWIDGTLGHLFAIPTVGFENGQAIPRAIHPNFRDALEYLKRIVDAGIIDPDWFVQDWLRCYDKIRAGNIGIVMMWMPGAMTVVEGGAGIGMGVEPNRRFCGTEWQFSDWALVETEGYRGAAGWDVNQHYWVVSQQRMAAEPGKMERLIHMVDSLTAPNEMGVYMGLVGAPAGGRIEQVGIGQRLDWSGISPEVLTNYRVLSWANWKYIQPMLNLLPWYAGIDPGFQQQVLDMQLHLSNTIIDVECFDRFILPNPDPEFVSIMADLEAFILQAQIDFVLGRRDLADWDAYVEEYLTRYRGQVVVDWMTEQILARGFR